MVLNYHNLKNNCVVFGDTNLSQGDLSENTRISTISLVEETEIERCIEKLFKKYPEVQFNTIQYYKKDKALYIYADQEVSINFSDFKEVHEYDESHPEKVVLDCLYPILNDTKKYAKSDYCNMLDLAQALYSVNNEFYNERFRITIDLASKLKCCFGEDHSPYIYDFEYTDENIIEIGIMSLASPVIEYPRYLFTFQNKEGKITLKETDCPFAEKVTSNISDEVSRIFDLKEKYKELFTFNRNVKLENSEACAYINNDQLLLKVLVNNPEMKQVEITIPFCDCKYYSLSCLSEKTANLLNGKEELIYKNAYVSKKNLPKLLQEFVHITPKGLTNFIKQLL